MLACNESVLEGVVGAAVAEQEGEPAPEPEAPRRRIVAGLGPLKRPKVERPRPRLARASVELDAVKGFSRAQLIPLDIDFTGARPAPLDFSPPLKEVAIPSPHVLPRDISAMASAELADTAGSAAARITQRMRGRAQMAGASGKMRANAGFNPVEMDNDLMQVAALL